ncbi:MAG: dehydratase [Deltaproteobacteria bacterium]|nr:dehydratase [Deltaproteobacteria bacterium]
MGATWDGIEEGSELPVLEKQPGVTQLVKYAAGSGDFNPLHHDFQFPQSKQLGSIIVHGRFKYAALGELVSNWLDHNGRVKKLSCQYRGMDFPDKKVTCKGSVSRKWEESGEKLAEVSIWTEDEDGKKTTPGEAIVVFN